MVEPEHEHSPAAGGYLESLDEFASLDEELMPVLAAGDFKDTRTFSDAVSKVAPDAAQDVRMWLASALQRGLVTRSPDGRFLSVAAASSATQAHRDVKRSL